MSIEYDKEDIHAVLRILEENPKGLKASKVKRLLIDETGSGCGAAIVAELYNRGKISRERAPGQNVYIYKAK